MSPEHDPTTSYRWLLAHSDRLIAYECWLREKSGCTSEMFPEELADRIGRPSKYVCAIIKNALSHAKSCKKRSSSTP